MSISAILEAFGINETTVTVIPFGSGLINSTWLVSDESNKFILQRINDNVFKNPEALATNIDSIGHYLSKTNPQYKFPIPLISLRGSSMFFNASYGYFRMFHFIDSSHSTDVVRTAFQAYEAAAQFGRFTRMLSGFDVNTLKITIPDFHNLSLRYQQFLNAIKNGNRDKIKESFPLIRSFQRHEGIVTAYKKIILNKNFKIRVTHHDTKISNVLFDNENKGLCVIDLDTVMPGYFFSDLGDMMRTYLSPVSEEEEDFSKIEIRDEFYRAVVQGYYNEMKEELTDTEKKFFFYAGPFSIYMQGLRFLTDHINNDIYYGKKYPGHNLVRAGNQAVLLERILEKQENLKVVL